jgi:hypothetical protein
MVVRDVPVESHRWENNMYSLQLSLKARRIVAAIGLSGLGALAILGGEAQAAASLTAEGTAQGYSLNTFVSTIPNNSVVGPVGIVNTTGGNIMISGYASGEVRVFGDTNNQLWTSGVAGGTAYGSGNVAGLAALNGNFYAALQVSDQVVRIDAAGNQIGTSIASIDFATSIIGDAARNSLFVGNNSFVYEINLANNAVSTFATVGSDGMSFSADGKTLYVADVFAGRIFGYDVSGATGTAGAKIFDSGYIAGGVDGTAVGTGSLLGHLFVNNNNGTLVDVNLTTLSQTTIVTGGSRGDFVWVDSNNGSLLFTQTDSVLRLTAPDGGGFVGAVPEPEIYAMIGVGLSLMGWVGRRRKLHAA